MGQTWPSSEPTRTTDEFPKLRHLAVAVPIAAAFLLLAILAKEAGHPRVGVGLSLLVIVAAFLLIARVERNHRADILDDEMTR